MPLRKNVENIKELFDKSTILKQQQKESLEVMEFVASSNNISEKMKSKILDLMIWNYTGAIKGTNGKCLVRYRSAFSMNDEKAELVHEHVYQRKKLISEIIEERKISKENISKMSACVVTKDQHKKLNSIKDKNIDGWDRYKLKRIKVFDMENRTVIVEGEN